MSRKTSWILKENDYFFGLLVSSKYHGNKNGWTRMVAWRYRVPKASWY